MVLRLNIMCIVSDVNFSHFSTNFRVEVDLLFVANLYDERLVVQETQTCCHKPGSEAYNN